MNQVRVFGRHVGRLRDPAAARLARRVLQISLVLCVLSALQATYAIYFRQWTLAMVVPILIFNLIHPTCGFCARRRPPGAALTLALGRQTDLHLDLGG